MRSGSLFTAAIVLCSASVSRAGVIASSTFDSGLDGWTLYTGDPGPNLAWSSIDGNLGGYLQTIDVTNPNGIVSAPGKFLGNWSALDGTGTLSFDHQLIDQGAGVFVIDPYVVLIDGPGGSAQWTGDTPTGPTPWVSLVVPIEESEWVVTSDVGRSSRQCHEFANTGRVSRE